MINMILKKDTYTILSFCLTVNHANIKQINTLSPSLQNKETSERYHLIDNNTFTYLEDIF